MYPLLVSLPLSITCGLFVELVLLSVIGVFYIGNMGMVLIAILFIGNCFVLELVASLKFALKFAQQRQINFDSRKYSALTLIPIDIGLSAWIANINFGLSTAMIIAAFLLYVRFLLVMTSEVHDLIYAVFPHSLATGMCHHFAKNSGKNSVAKIVA